ncbi:hypothetical protein NVV43_25600, partial [Escherichia marmotae]|nr:hypothetical protein [Escherichia marmotae]
GGCDGGVNGGGGDDGVEGGRKIGFAAPITVRAVGLMAIRPAPVPDASLQNVTRRSVRDLSANNGTPPISPNKTPHTIHPATAP